jgi:hypothetical protein
MVTLSVQVFAVPPVANVLKFSVRGEPSAVMLPLFVRADERGRINEIANTLKRTKAGKEINVVRFLI